MDLGAKHDAETRSNKGNLDFGNEFRTNKDSS
jgi:hypothetical protein